MAERVVTIESVLQLARGGKLAEAVIDARELVAARNDDADATGLLALLLQEQGQFAEAVALFQRAVTLRPAAPALHFHLGAALRAAGRDAEAVTPLRQAVALNRDYADAHLLLGNVLKRLGRFEEASVSLREAARLAPKDGATWLNLGVSELEQRHLDEAVACFRRAIEVEPRRPEAHNILGVVLLDRGDVRAAQAALSEALRLRPNLAAAHDNLGRALKTEGRMTDAVAEYRAALAIAPAPATHSNLLLALNYIPGLTPAEVFAEHRRWAAQHEEPLVAERMPHTNTREPGRRLRIGFVSPDFNNHAVAYFIEPVLAERRHTEWEVICYSDVAVGDWMTERLRSQADVWHDTAMLTDEQLAGLIREDRTDILVDLAGHTARNRLLAFARKPAPVQVTWIGYPNTTGLSAIDYRVTDVVSDPPVITEAFHSEKLLRLPGVFSCYLPPKVSPAVAAPPMMKRGAPRFGSFSNFAKVSDPCVAVWAGVLLAVPGSRLILKSRGFGDPAVAVAALCRFTRNGVDPERIVLDGELVSVADHLKLYDQIDVALDPFPYNGTTTTCEALWMGVPVVTLEGATHVSRVGASLLTHLGRQEWIARDPAAYVELVVKLTSDVTALAATRAAQRERMRLSPICDAPRFARHLETAFREIWRAYCSNR